MRTLKKSTKTYKKILQHFNKQFGDVIEMTKLYINSDSKVFAGEWIDSKGIVNFNSGCLPDVVEIVEVK